MNHSGRSICLQAVSPTSPIYGMEARSSFATDAMQQDWNKVFGFVFPPLQPDRSGDKQGSSGKCRSNDTSDTHMTDTTLVYSPIKNVHTMSIAFTSPPKPITKSPGRKTSSFENQVPKVSGVKNYRKSFEIERIPNSAAKPTRCPATRFNCRLRVSWNKWVSWCCRQQIDSLCAPLSGISNLWQGMTP